MTPSPPAVNGQQIAELRKQFKSAWRENQSPRLEQFLEGLPKTVQGQLFVELLTWELHWLSRQNQAPDLEDYLSRFPQYREVIQHTFRRSFAESGSTVEEPTVAIHSAQPSPVSPSASSQSPLSQFPQPDNYRVLSLLGRGGMGLVYRAEQKNPKRVVALKMVSDNFMIDDLLRFHGEIQAVARLKHPGIVQLYEVGNYQGRPFFAMELVEGGSLRGKMGVHTFSQEEAATIIAAIARAIGHAHAHNIVHRDLKPGNILLTNEDEPRISDFGIAKLLDAEEGQTQTGAVIGTPEYMSPEQARGQSNAVGPATDIYALGVMLYEMLTGHRPIEGCSEIHVLQNVLTEEPISMSSWRPEISRDLEAICQKCLEKEPHRRYSSAEGLANDLTRWLNREPVHARPVSALGRLGRWVRRKPLSAAVLGLSLLCCVILAAAAPMIWMAYRNTEAAEARANSEATEARKQQQLAEKERRKADGQVTRLQAATGARLLENGDLFRSLLWTTSALRRENHLRQLHPSEVTDSREELLRLRAQSLLEHCPPLVHSAQAPLWTRRIHFRTENEVFLTDNPRGPAQVWDLSTGKLRTVPIPQEAQVSAFTVDGKSIVYRNAAKRWILSDLKTPEKQVTLESPHPQLRLVDTIFTTLPQNHLLFGRNGYGGCVWSTKTGKLIWKDYSLNDWDRPQDLLYTQDGSRVLYCRARFITLYETATDRVLFRLNKELKFSTTIAISPDGRFVAFSDQERQLEIWDMQKNERHLPHQSPTHSDVILQVAFDQQGRRLITVAEDATVAVWDVETGRSVCPPLKHGGVVRHARLSPNQRFLLTVCDDGSVRVWDCFTAQPVTPVLRHGPSVITAAWSGEGSRIATLAEDGSLRVWDLVGEQSPIPIHAEESAISLLRFDQSARRLLIGTKNGAVTVWDLKKRSRSGPSLRHAGKIIDSDWDDTGKRVLTVGDRAVRAWDLTTGKPLSQSLGKHLGNNLGVSRACFLRGSDRMIIGFADRAIVHDLKARRDLIQIKIPANHLIVDRLRSSPDGSRFLITDHMNTLHQYESATGKLLHTFELPPSRAMTELRYESETEILATGSFGLRIWDVKSGKLIKQFSPGKKTVRASRISACSRRLVTVTRTNECQVWDLKSEQPLGPTVRPGGPIRYAGLVGKNEMLITIRKDGQIRLWDGGSGEPITPARYYGSYITRVAASRDGSQVALGARNGEVYLWSLPRPTRLQAATLHRSVEQFVGEFIDQEKNVILPGSPGTSTSVSAIWGRATDRVTQQALRREWHQRLAADGQRRQEWTSLLFHADQALRLIENQKTKKALVSSLEARRVAALTHLQRNQEAVQTLKRLALLEPGECEHQLALAKIHAKINQWDEALREVKLALSKKNDDVRLWAWQSVILQRLGKEREAQQSIRQVQELVVGLENLDVYNGLSSGFDPQRIYQLKREWKPMIQEWGEWLSHPSTVKEKGLEVGLCRARGLGHLILGESDQAESDFQRAFQLANNDPEICRALAGLAFKKGDWNQAYTYTNQATRSSPKDGSLWYLRALAAARVGKATESFNNLTQAINQGADHANARLQRGMMYFVQNRFPEAISDFNQALQHERGLNSSTWFLRGRAYLFQNKHREAASDFRRAAELETLSNPSYVRVALMASFQASELDKARELMIKVLQGIPRSIENNYNQVVTLTWLGALADVPKKELDRWAPFVDRSIGENKQVRFYRVVRALLSVRQGQPQLALKELSRLEKTSAFPLLELIVESRAHVELNQFDKAREVLTQVNDWVQKNPQAASTWSRFPDFLIIRYEVGKLLSQSN